MFTDMVGYTALGQKNESLSLALVEEQRRVIRPILARHNGREVKTIGDAFLVEFPSALDAVRCAYDIQRAIREFNLSLAADRRIHLRIGVHVGEIVDSGGDISGDAVNVASRIEPLAEDGGVCITRQVYDFVRNKVDIPLTSLGPKSLKNVAEPMDVYRMVMPWEKEAAAPEVQLVKNRIAILPFTSFSLDPNDSFFADGMTEEIISTVSGLSGLDVISRTSVMGYKSTTKKVEEIGKELKVGSILEGSFRKVGNRIRVTAQLIEVASDRHLWVQNYDRDLNDVFEVQSDVAKQVAEALRVKILSSEKARIEKKPTVSTTAYTLYLKGRQLWNTRRLDDIKKAREYFEQAVKDDPDFALGYAGQADCCSILRSNFAIESDINLEKAKALAVKALALDPDLAEAHTTMGFNLMRENGSQAETEFKKAIELKPSYATAHQWYSTLLRRLLRWDEALEQIEKAEELDPLSPIITLNHSECLQIMGRIPEALRVLESAERLDPRSVIILRGKAVLLLITGKTTEAGDCFERASKIDPYDLALLDLLGHYEQFVGNYPKAFEYWETATKRGRAEGGEVTGYNADFASAYWLTGEKSKALDCVKQIEALPEDTNDARSTKLSLMACAYAATGNSESFFLTADRMFSNSSAGDLVELFRYLEAAYPASQDFRHDKRWSELFRKAGLEV